MTTPTLSPPRKFTSKQMGDACEMLVAAELTLAGVPALKVPDNWPHYDVIAQPVAGPPQRVSVKSRTWKRGAAYLDYNSHDEFEWSCAVILEAGKRRLFLIPREVADSKARKDRSPRTAHLRYFRVDQVAGIFAEWENNFALDRRPAVAGEEPDDRG
ncbi:hypothetical protein [Sphingobium sp. B12D2B]|uniref:hypothetical protein n=1 Tax=Sphingobium sp. B12D2B TaxID=2940577 RepID=UPI0022256233|nr:hypothetical protein [Sphingobium sp. B12D2B]MCW2349176.1 hypothetical protein [Sphingobium sp. B12D2B]